MTEAPWLLLILTLPPAPAYLRVKLRRRLARLGATPIKDAVYALPNDPSHYEDFEWLAREVESDGGTATICAATILRGGRPGGEPSPGRPVAAGRPGRRLEPGRCWVTRKGVGVDRIASAWLIRRRIDPAARFKFVTEPYRPRAGELRFDTFEAEFGHEGRRCTFETLLFRFGLRDRALRVVGEIVHDLDLKDDRFGHPETAGVGALIEGLVRSTSKDLDRLARGAEIFDGLHRAVAGRPSSRRVPRDRGRVIPS